MKNLLVPIDFSDSTDEVVLTAEQLARAFDAKVWLLHCVAEESAVGTVGEIPMYVPVPDTPISIRFAQQYHQLIDLATSLLHRGIDAEPLFVSGAAIDKILLAADAYDADLIIVGSHGHGALYDLLVGTVTKSILQRALRPTLIVPSNRAATHSQFEMQEVMAD